MQGATFYGSRELAELSNLFDEFLDWSTKIDEKATIKSFKGEAHPVYKGLIPFSKLSERAWMHKVFGHELINKFTTDEGIFTITKESKSNINTFIRAHLDRAIKKGSIKKGSTKKGSINDEINKEKDDLENCD